ncbi:TonB-dependent receptor [uncultured Paraglaciecola sp.]|uniref:TonB-dependent receptor n=1 Tax=uncultured Paraglaciecola sp. TaxID=1765024 RepID=UPI0030DD7F0E|tara:strand:- start:39205 stop:41826 length:2622 start_codon:yes stop_codon:yes gene_type:complete
MKTSKTTKVVQFIPKKHIIAQGVYLAMICLTTSPTVSAEESEKASAFEVIEVTAQKRVQNVMQVPITVGIVSSDLLEQSNSIMLGDIDKFIPGFDFNDGSVTQAGVSIRGISSPNISVGGDPSSATFYDDVYMPRAAQNVLFSDIERIEVLKGPQGTLFGRNAAMGVVNIIPKKPIDDTEGFVKLSLGTDSLKRAEAMVNMALSDSVFIRANLLSNTQDGFVKNISEPQWNNNSKIYDLGALDHQAARLSLLWDLAKGSEFQLSVELDDLNQAPPMAVGLSEFALNGGSDPFAAKVENDVKHGIESRDMYAVTAKFLHDFDENWSMKFVTSYRNWETVNREDEDGTARLSRYLDTSNNEDSSIFYTELQVNYVSDKVSAVAGFSYSKEDVSQQTELNLTADTIARLTTGELNNTIRAGVAQQLAAAIGGNSDDIAAAVFGPGVTFEAAVDSTFAASGFPVDHIWNADEWAGALNALGFAEPILQALGMPGATLNGDIIAQTGDLTYDLVSGQLGVPEIFGPSHSGEFWQENIFNTGDFTNWGVFADVDYALTAKWHVIAGLRYSKDSKDFSWFIPVTSFAEVRPGVSNQLFPQVDITASDSWSKVTGRLVTNYQIDKNQMVFASYSTGYKSGGFDSLSPIDQSAGQSAFAPEDSSNFEVGYKALLGESLITNISFYQSELDNFQVAVESRQPDSTTAVPTIINENRQIAGVELDMRWMATNSLTLGLVTEIRNTDIDTPAFYDSTGELLPEQSRSSDANTNYTLTLDWAPDFDLGAVNVHVDYVFVENSNADRADIQAFELAIPAYLSDRKRLNTRFSITTHDETMEFALWSRNLLDERYVESISNISTATMGTPFAKINRGREVGVEFKYSF